MAKLMRNIKAVVWFTVEMSSCEGKAPTIWMFGQDEQEKALSLAAKMAFNGTPVDTEYAANGRGVFVNVIAWSGHPSYEDSVGMIVKQIGGGQ